MVQSNKSKVRLRPVRIGLVCTGHSRPTHNPANVNLFKIQSDVGLNFQAAMFCRFAKIIVEHTLENALESDIVRKRLKRITGYREIFGWGITRIFMEIWTYGRDTIKNRVWRGRITLTTFQNAKVSMWGCKVEKRKKRDWVTCYINT